MNSFTRKRIIDKTKDLFAEEINALSKKDGIRLKWMLVLKTGTTIMNCERQQEAIRCSVL